MYCNRHALTNKDGTLIYYYYCSHSDKSRGVVCDYKAKLRKIDIEPLVIEIIKALVAEQHYADVIKSHVGPQLDTSKIEVELKNYLNKLREVELNKVRQK